MPKINCPSRILAKCTIVDESACGTHVQKFRRILAHTIFICAGHVIPGIWNYPCASLVTSLIATSMAPPIPTFAPMNLSSILVVFTCTCILCFLSCPTRSHTERPPTGTEQPGGNHHTVVGGNNHWKPRSWWKRLALGGSPWRCRCFVTLL